MNTIGNAIKYIRKQNHWTQGKLSDESGVAVHTICAYETGRYTPITETVNLLLNAMGYELSVRRKTELA